MARNSSEFVPDSNTEFPAVPEIRVEKIKIEEVRASIPLKDLESKKTKKSKKCKNLIFDIGKDAKASSSKICGLEHLPVSNHGKGADSSDPGIEFLVNEKVKGTKKAKFSKPKDPKGPKGNKNETAKVEGFPATETDDFITPTTSATAYTNKPTLFSKFTHLACTIFLKEFILFILCNFWTALIIDICLNVLYIISFYAISYPYCVVHSCPVVMLLIDAVLITLKVWDRCARRFLPEEKKIVWGWFRRQHVLFLVRVLKQLVLFVIIGMIIGKIVFLIGGTINNPLDVSRSVMLNLDLNLVNRILLIIFASISIFADFYLLSHLWKLPEKGSGSILLLAISCFANFLLGIIEIKLYHDSMIFKNVGSTAEAYEPLRVLPVIYLYTAAFVICGSTLGLALTAIVTESNRLSDTVGKMTIFLDCYFLIVTLLALISCANSLVLRGGEQDPRYHIALGIPTIFGCSVILSILIIICSRYTRSRLPPSLEVEELNLKDLTDAQKSAYAKLITFNTKANPGISGEAVILLMESYTAANLEGMSCRVLRVFRPEINVNSYDVNGKKMKGNRRNILNFKNSKEKENNHNQNDDDNYNEKFNKKNIDGSNASFSLSTSSIYSVNNEYEASKTWEVLDLQKTVFDEEETIFSIESVEPPKVLSKNQRKKLAKKAAAAAANGDITGEFPLELPTEKDIRDRAKFHSDLMATEALILLTTIESYDLTASIQGKFGKFMTRHFGAESKYKLLCIRFGLLAFHWPFIRSTFYCSNSKKPVARSAAVMYAINRWNNQQSKGERRTILLDPTYKNAVPEQAIRFGGWLKIGLPASHIINLRPYKNKTITEYFKAIKYRNQDGPYRQANGLTVEEKEFTEENCAVAMNLWRNIAKNRTSNGNTSVLIDPNEKFMETIGTEANLSSQRTLLFLKVDNEVIASCILFRLGDTITSDLQGLHEEKARPMKAYFVMMQEVITIALREGKSFVDFGPTTEKPKVDIGCQKVPLTGALRTSNIFLSLAVKIAADSVKV